MINATTSTSAAALNSGAKRTSKIPYAGKERKIPVPGPKAPGASAADSFPAVYPYKGTRIVARDFGDVAVFGPGTQKLAAAPTWGNDDRLFHQDSNLVAQFTSLDQAMKWVDETVGKMVDPRCQGIPVELQTQNRKNLTDEQRARVEEIAGAAAKAKSTNPELATVVAEIAERKKQKRAGAIAKKAAQASGATAAMPLQGTAAIAAITGKTPKGKTPKGMASKKKAKPAPSSAKGTSKPKKGKPAPKAAPKTAKRASKPAATVGKAAKAPKSGEAGLRPGSKAEKIAKLLLRKEGTTAAEVMKVCDWPSVSMPAQAKAAGLKLRKEKVDGVTRYYGAE